MDDKLPFELDKTIELYRIQLTEIISKEYSQIDNNIKDSSQSFQIKNSKLTQQKIFNSFLRSIDTLEFKAFRDNFNSIIALRDESLERYVKNSVEYIKTWRDNVKLREAHFLQTNARDRKTGSVDTKIVQIPGYYDEKTIHLMLKNKTSELIPGFGRLESKINEETLKEIELLSVSNITGLYNANDVIRKNSSLFNSLQYKIYSRVKTSDRERDKFIDWLLGLRDFDDYPYDPIGIITVLPNTNENCIDCGSDIYKFRDYIIDMTKKHKNMPPKQKNVKSIFENNNSSVKKLLDEKYYRENYYSVIRQLRVTTKDLDDRFRNKNPILDSIEESKLLQGIQLKHRYENDRAETWIMNHEMYESYTGRYIGHTEYYIKTRELQRKTFLNNPSLSYANSKNPKLAEPSLTDLENYFAMFFRNVFRSTNSTS